ncbi:MAG: O-antigen ligase family protein [Steroidobacteraceae bacterium]
MTTSSLQRGHASDSEAVRLPIPPTVLLVLFVPGHLFDWSVEWAWLGLQLLMAALWFSMPQNRMASTAGIGPLTWVSCFVLFSLCGFVGSMYGGTILGLEASAADLSDLLRFLISIPLVLFVGSAIREAASDAVARALKLMVLFNLVCSAIVLLPVPVASNLVMLVYEGAKVQYEFGQIRIGIPFANPNFAALVFLLSFSYFAFFSKSPLFAALCLVSLFITGSRSGFIATLPLLMLAYVRVMNWGLSRPSALLVLVVLHAIPLYYLARVAAALEGFGRVMELIQAVQVLDISQVETAAIRFATVENALQFIRESPFFGIGPGRAYGLDVTDAQLVAWPLMYGIPCAILIGGLFSSMFLSIAWRTRKRGYSLAAIATLMSFFLMLATGDFMKNYRLFFISVLIVHCMGLIATRPTSIALKSDAKPGEALGMQGAACAE